MKRWMIKAVLFCSLGLRLAAGAAPVTVEQCIDAALSANPGLEAAAQQIAAAAAAHLRAKAAYYPRLGVQAQYGLTDNPTQAFMMELNQRNLDMSNPSFDPNNPADTDTLRLSASLRWMLYDGGRRRAKVGMATQQTGFAALQRDAARNNLVFGVTRGYYQSLQALAMERVRADAVTSLAASLRIAEARHKAGSVVKTDVLNLRVQLAAAQEDEIRASNGTLLAMAGLNAAIGRRFVTYEQLAVPDSFVAPPAPPYIARATVEQRAEYQAALTQMRIGALDWKRAKGRHLPDVNAFGSYDYDAADLDEAEGSYFAGVQASWPLFTGFEKSGDIRQAKANSQGAAARARSIHDKLELELQQAQLSLNESAKRSTVALTAIESAAEALRITRALYQEGAADISQLLVAEVGQTESRTRAAAAFFDVRIAEAAVGRANGTLAPHYLGTLEGQSTDADEPSSKERSGS